MTTLTNNPQKNQFTNISKRWWIGIAAFAGLFAFYVDRGFEQFVGQFFAMDHLFDFEFVRMILRRLWLPLFLTVGQYLILRLKINRSYLWLILTPVIWYVIEYFSPVKNWLTSSMFGLAFARQQDFFLLLQNLIGLIAFSFFHGVTIGLPIGFVQSLICKLKRTEMIQWSLWSAFGLGVAFLLTNLTQGLFLMDSIRSLVAHERLLAYFSIVVAFLFSEGFFSFIFYGIFTASRFSMLFNDNLITPIEKPENPAF